MHTETALRADVERLFSEKLFIDVPSPNADLIDEGIMDSLTLVGLLAQLETEYGFTVEMDNLDIEDFRTVHRIAEYVERHRKVSDVNHALRGA